MKTYIAPVGSSKCRNYKGLWIFLSTSLFSSNAHQQQRLGLKAASKSASRVVEALRGIFYNTCICTRVHEKYRTINFRNIDFLSVSPGSSTRQNSHGAASTLLLFIIYLLVSIIYHKTYNIHCTCSGRQVVQGETLTGEASTSAWSRLLPR